MMAENINTQDNYMKIADTAKSQVIKILKDTDIDLMREFIANLRPIYDFKKGDELHTIDKKYEDTKKHYANYIYARNLNFACLRQVCRDEME